MCMHIFLLISPTFCPLVDIILLHSLGIRTFQWQFSEQGREETEIDRELSKHIQQNTVMTFKGGRFSFDGNSL